MRSLVRLTAWPGLGLLCVLAGHFAAAQQPAAGSAVALRVAVIPTGFEGAKYSALIQIAVDGSPLPNATWDLDASFVSGTQAPEVFSGRVVAGEPGTPVVYEVEVEFEPGSFALALGARETTAGQSGTSTLNGRWPDPRYEPATVSPIWWCWMALSLASTNTTAMKAGSPSAPTPRASTATCTTPT